MSSSVATWSIELFESDELEMFQVATDVLREFGTIEVVLDGAGIECAPMSFRFDPLLAEGEGDRFRRFHETIGEKLYPLGDVEMGIAFLAISETGRVFLVGDDIYEKGTTIDRALVALVEGLAGRRLR